MTYTRDNALYVVAESSEPGDDAFVGVTGYTRQQFIAELFARIAYRLGSVGHEFQGRIETERQVVTEHDWWDEDGSGGRRTWHRSGERFVYRPWTLSDVRVVTRVGRAWAYLDRDGGAVSGSISLGEDGLVWAASAEAKPILDEMAAESSIDIAADCEELAQFIQADGRLTY